MTSIPEGHALIPGRGKAKAQAALAAAAAAGVSPKTVRTVTEGYVVPAAVAAEYEKTLKPAAPKKRATTKKTTAKKAAEEPEAEPAPEAEESS